MNNIFQYSILKYVHSDILGESLNVGVLFYFPNENAVVFKHPKTLSRFKDVYLNAFPDQLVLSTLKGITARCYKINESNVGLFRFLPWQGFDSVIEGLIPEDSTALRFGRINNVALYGDRSKVTSDYYNLLFKYFDDTPNIVKRNDEEFISKQLKKHLRSINPNYQKFINTDVVIKAPVLPDGEFPFDFAWKNHVTHYVKPLSFDLAESKSINAKAALYYGYLSAISKDIGENKVDIVTSVPQKKSLWPQYEKAIEMIEKVDIKKEIIDQNQYAKYAEMILDNEENLN